MLKLSRFQDAQVKLKESLQIQKTLPPHKKSNEDVLKIKQKIGACLIGLSRYEEALASLNSVLETKSNMSDEIVDDYYVAEIYLEIACCYYFLEEFAYSNESAKNSLLVFEKRSEKKHARAKTLFVLGSSLYQMNHSEQAQIYLNEAIFVCDTVLENHSDDACLFKWAGYCMLAAKKNQEAILCFRESLEINKTLSLNAEDDHAVARSLYELGYSYYFSGNETEAKNYFERVIGMIRCTSESISTDRGVALVYTQHAHCMYTLREFIKAEASFMKALDVFTKTSQNISADYQVADTRYWIGRCRLGMKNNQKALKIFYAALDILEKHFSNKNSLLADTYYFIGFILQASDFVKAEDFLRRALQLYKELTFQVPCNPISVAYTNYALGVCLFYRKKFEEGKNIFKRALEVFEKDDVGNNIDAARTHNWIGRCLKSVKQFDEAMLHFLRSWTICESQQSLDASDTIFYFGRCLLDENQPNEAIKNYFETALKMYEKMPSDANIDGRIAHISNWIGRAFLKMKTPEKALVWFQKSLKLYENVTPLETAKNQNIAKAYRLLGYCFYHMKNSEKAMIYFKKAFTIYNELNLETMLPFPRGFNQLHLDLLFHDRAKSLNWIGRCLVNLEKEEDAELYFRQALSIYRQRPKECHINSKIVDTLALIENWWQQIINKNKLHLIKTLETINYDGF